MLNPVITEAGKLGAHEKKAAPAETVAEMAHSIADSASKRIINMIAADTPNLQVFYKGGPNLYAWNGTEAPENQAQVYGDTLTVSSINMPDGPNAPVWNNVVTSYHIPASEMKAFSGPMTATSWQSVNFSELQLKSVLVEDDGDVPGVTLTATDGDYTFDGPSTTTPVTQSEQLQGFATMADRTLTDLETAQDKYGLAVG